MTTIAGESFDPVALAADIVAAYVANNNLPVAELAGLIASVHAAIVQIERLGAAQAVKPVELKPAVPVQKSITPDFLTCLDDGKQFKSLKRHLSALGLTPDQYRAKWKLPADYPMVAPNYAAARSTLAMNMGLGAGKRGRPRKAPAEASAE